MSDVRRTKKSVERLSRGQSHDLLTRLENCGLTPYHASMIVECDACYARAMVAVVDTQQDWYIRIRDWFRTNRFDRVKAPMFEVPLGERVERALRNQVPFYLPPTRELTMRELLDHEDANGSRFDLGWGAAHVIGPAPFAKVPEGYWFWMELGGDYGHGERYLEARKTPDAPYFTSERIAAHAASLEEFLIGSIIGSALGRPFDYGDPHRLYALRTTVRVPAVTGGGAPPERDEYLLSFGVCAEDEATGIGRKAVRRRFRWDHSTLHELETAYRAELDCWIQRGGTAYRADIWDYCWVERIAPPAA
jgi:hypothetical protein